MTEALRQMAGTAMRVERTPLSDEPDETLVLRVLAGEEQFFEQIVRRHEAPVYRHLYRLLKSREEAEDIAQETFVLLWRNLRSFREGERCRPWLYRIATNAAISRLRRRKVTVDIESIAPPSDEPHRRPDHRAADIERLRHLQDAVECLPAETRAIFNLRYAEEMSLDEIAAATGKSFTAVGVTLHRARHRLRQLLIERIGEQP